ncbi:MAG: hypothetical protein KGH73_09905 [Xanthomonadaceae bacterium]|nr:hypothetical protein [Xanthomonadaceae bacterium]
MEPHEGRNPGVDDSMQHRRRGWQAQLLGRRFAALQPRLHRCHGLIKTVAERSEESRACFCLPGCRGAVVKAEERDPSACGLGMTEEPQAAG